MSLLRSSPLFGYFPPRVVHFTRSGPISTADTLSQYPYTQCEKELDVTYLTTVVSIDNTIYEAIRKLYEDDNFFGPIIKNPEHYPRYTVKDPLIFLDDRLCIPDDRPTKETLLTMYHDDQNYFGGHKTQAAIVRDYFWPGVTKDIGTYIKSCDSRIRNKSSTQSPTGFLHPMPVPSAHFREIAMDFVGHLPRLHSFDSVIIVTDRLMNYLKIEPTKTSVTAPEIADLFYQTWYRQCGLPTAITSDRDKLFIGRFWKELMKKVDVHLRMSMAYRPETDGSSERSNKMA